LTVRAVTLLVPLANLLLSDSGFTIQFVMEMKSDEN
jgi:hypothetical protein